MNTPEYGNDQFCANCGDEWAPLDSRNLCPDCADVLDKSDSNPERINP